MPRFSIKARLITFFKNRRTVDIWNNEILLRKSMCLYRYKFNSSGEKRSIYDL